MDSFEDLEMETLGIDGDKAIGFFLVDVIGEYMNILEGLG